MINSIEEYDRAQAAERRRGCARYERVMEALKDVPLSEFTVGQLSDIHYLVSRDWSMSGGSPQVLERLERMVEERACQLKHGTFVRYKNPKKGQRGKGIITSRPRRGTQLVYVQGPRGWAGWARVDELEVIPP